MKDFEIGIYTLGDYVTNAETGNIVSEQQRIEDIISYAKLADEVNLDVLALGESHQEHFISQAHALILAAIARETKNIRVSSSATIVSTSDPVRIYENFSTLDILSNGRAEIVGGRASRIGLFSLLGFDVADYTELFEEKFELLLKLNKEEIINWQGHFRPALKDAVLYPKPLQASLPIWRAVGGPAESARKAGIQGVPMMLATLAGPVTHFNRTVDSYLTTFKQYHQDLSNMRVGITNMMHVADTDELAYNRFYKYMNHSFKQANGHGLNPEVYSTALDLRNAVLIGSAETIIEKIVYQYEVYGHTRQMLQIDIGGLEADEVRHQIEVIGNVIAPEVRRRIAALGDNNEDSSN